MTRQEVAQELNISIQMVTNIELKALRKIRAHLLKIAEKETWTDYIINSREADLNEYLYFNTTGL